MFLAEVLNYSSSPGSPGAYFSAVMVFVLVILILGFVRKKGLKKIKKATEKTKTKIDDLIIEIVESVDWFFYFILALYLASQIAWPSIIIGKIFIVVLIYYLVRAIQKLIDFGTKEAIFRNDGEEDSNPSIIRLASKVLKILLWAGAVIIVLQNLGYNVSALVAGLGIGGVAIAFALQNVLTDIFASFSIYFDRPFQVGDYIVIGSDSGTVKKIGIKSTRIQTLQGQELVMSNKELTESRVNNYKKMEKRRISFPFGIEYGTSVEKLKKIPQIVKDVINKNELSQLDRVHFKEFGDSSLNFEVVYYLQSSDYNKYMDIQEKINLGLIEHFEREGIIFAYPTQTIHLNKEN